MKETNPSFNSFSPYSLFNPFFAQTITIAIVIAIHSNNCQQCMQPALSPPLPPSPATKEQTIINNHCHRDDSNYYQHMPYCRRQHTVVAAATTTPLLHFQMHSCYR
jgi:hypothetical protein